LTCTTNNYQKNNYGVITNTADPNFDFDLTYIINSGVANAYIYKKTLLLNNSPFPRMPKDDYDDSDGCVLASS
jgi:hypothetical protein